MLDPGACFPGTLLPRHKRGKRSPAYVNSALDHVQFGFFAGARLKDPKGLLRGEGKFVRHIRLVKPPGTDEPPFRALLRQAAR